MTYSSLQTIAIICYMIAGGFLAVSVLIFFLWDMSDIIGRLTGSSQKKALANMRSSGTVGKTGGGNIVDMSRLEKKTGSPADSSGRLSRRSGRTAKGQAKTNHPVQPKVVSQPIAQSSTPDYFGAPYPNKTPPAPVPSIPEPQTSVMDAPLQQTTVIQVPPSASAGGETMDLEAWQRSQAAAAVGQAAQQEVMQADDAIEPVPLVILDDIMLVHTETFIDI